MIEQAEFYQIKVQLLSPDENLIQIWTAATDTPQNVCRNQFAPYYFWRASDETLISAYDNTLTAMKATDRANPKYKFYKPTVFVDGERDYKTVSKHLIPWALANRPEGILGQNAYDAIMEHGLYSFGGYGHADEIQIHHNLHVDHGDDPEYLTAMKARIHAVV